MKAAAARLSGKGSVLLFDPATAAASVSLAGLTAHLSEIWPVAELEPEHQGAVCHSAHIFTLCRDKEGEPQLHKCVGQSDISNLSTHLGIYYLFSDY